MQPAEPGSGQAGSAPGLLRLLARILPDTIGAGSADPRLPQPEPWPGESRLGPNSAEKRRREFAAGRAAARAAMSSLGLPAAAVPSGADRAPVWPAGLCGSVSHCDSGCLALTGLQTRWTAIGIDLEPALPLPEKLIPAIAADAEREMLESTGPGQSALMARVLFSAKEAAFKAQYTRSRQFIGFKGAELRFGPDQGQFTITLNVSAPPFGKGAALAGRYVIGAGHIITLVTLPA